MGKTYKAMPPEDYDDGYDEYDPDFDDFDEDEGFYDLSDEYSAGAELKELGLSEAAEGHYEAGNEGHHNPSKTHYKNAGHGPSRRPEMNVPPRQLPHDWEDFDYGLDASNDDDREDLRWG